jgi:hypothetical protein
MLPLLVVTTASLVVITGSHALIQENSFQWNTRCHNRYRGAIHPCTESAFRGNCANTKPQHIPTDRPTARILLSHETLVRSSSSTALLCSAATKAQENEHVLQTLESLRSKANEYADTYGLGPTEAAIFALFLSIRQSLDVSLGLKGKPFVLRGSSVEGALQQSTQWANFFTMADLEQALTDDFLDAARGSTDNRKGWKVRQ